MEGPSRLISREGVSRKRSLSEVHSLTQTTPTESLLSLIKPSMTARGEAMVKRSLSSTAQEIECSLPHVLDETLRQTSSADAASSTAAEDHTVGSQETDSVEPTGAKEPRRKRRVAAPSSPPAIVNEGDTEGTTNLNFHSIRKEVNIKDLPDPTADISPDEYLKQLVKALHGVELEAKPGLALVSFFEQVSEEQMAAYTMEAVGAVRGNNLEELKKLHKEGQTLDCFNRFGESLLNMACRRGFEEIAQYLLVEGGLNVRICDDGGRTPLHDACWNPSPQLKICKWIIERDPSLLFVADRRGCTAFQYARPQHWDVWRKFLLDNRDSLSKLNHPDLLSRLLVES